MLIERICESSAYYMVIYNEYIIEHYARDVRELENIKRQFKDCKILMDILDTLHTL